MLNTEYILNTIFIFWCIYLIFDCCMQRPCMSLLEKIAWVTFIVVLPPIGSLAYFVVVMLLRNR